MISRTVTLYLCYDCESISLQPGDCPGCDRPLEEKEYIPAPKIGKLVKIQSTRGLRDLTDNPIRHVFLFAKGHYQRTFNPDYGHEPMLVDVTEVIKRAYDLERCMPDDVFKLILPWVWDSLGGPVDFQEMILFMRTQFLYIEQNQEVSLGGIDEAICRMMLVMMAIRETRDELLLGEADPDIMNCNSQPGKYKKKFNKKK